MKAEIWGKSGWIILYAIAKKASSPDQRKFFDLLQYVLPCEKCRLHYAIFLRSNPIDEKTVLLEWVQKLHQSVNQRINKPIPTESQSQSQIEAENHYWKFLFAVAYEYPKKPTLVALNRYKEFFQCLQNVLPIKWHQRSLPIDSYLINNEYLFDWLIKTYAYINNLPIPSRQQIINQFSFGSIK
jgi:hypothetical protein